MSFKRRIKRLESIKGKPNKVGTGVPIPGQGKDGDIQIRETQDGVAIFGRLNGSWFKFSSDGTNVNKLVDNTGGTSSNVLADTGGTLTAAKYENGVASLANKVNEIIDSLK